MWVSKEKWEFLLGKMLWAHFRQVLTGQNSLSSVSTVKLRTKAEGGKVTVILLGKTATFFPPITLHGCIFWGFSTSVSHLCSQQLTPFFGNENEAQGHGRSQNAQACGWVDAADPEGLLPGPGTAVVAVASLSELWVLLGFSSESLVPFPIAEIHWGEDRKIKWMSRFYFPLNWCFFRIGCSTLLTLLVKASVINEDKVILTVSLPCTSRANEHIRSWFCAGPAFDLCIFLADLGYALLLSYNKRERFFYWSLQHAAAIIIGEPQVVWFMVFNVNPWGSVRRDYLRYKTFCRIVLPHFSSNLQWASFIYLPAPRQLI